MVGDEQPKAPAGSGVCGCLAAAGFLILVGLPVLLVLSFGLSPCQQGPCDPNGRRNLFIAGAVLLALAAVIGLATWRLVAWWLRRQAERGRDGRRQLEIAAGALLLLGGAFIVYVIMA